jgi:predicted nucleic acid-binding protein
LSSGGITEDDHHRSASALLVDPRLILTTLDLVRYEVANVAVRAWRAPKAVASLLAAVERIADDGGVIESTATLLAHAAELAEQHTISVYDAAYVAAADQADRRLVSCDDRDLVSKALAIHPASARAS